MGPADLPPDWQGTPIFSFEIRQVDRPFWGHSGPNSFPRGARCCLISYPGNSLLFTEKDIRQHRVQSTLGRLPAVRFALPLRTSAIPARDTAFCLLVSE